MANQYTSNVSLAKPIIEHIQVEDFTNFKSALRANADTINEFIAGDTAIAGTNPSIVNTIGKRWVSLYACSAGSISTITGMLRNVPFTLIMVSSGASLAYLNANTNAHLSANWIPAVEYGNLTLVWDGTRYIEVGRVTTA